ncbi:PREDICTED: latrophilin-like protein LAT-2 [Acropora digitifera]|uniref:latrophilin-like protein LAT-2 n=1 Tax=Acropora digitifera TaxID=70779 RepID=UPI00077A765F|nr:PREDICTED: latrophilin-like protein LAT-2 [Acropora digitifera]
MFSWTLVEAWHLYLALVEVFCAQKKSLLKRYYILGYGLPSGMTALSVAIFWENYGMGNMCWMTDVVLLSLFLPPIVVVVMANVVILGMVIGVLISPTVERRQKLAAEKTLIHNLRINLKGCLILLPLLGVTWLLAFLQANSPEISYFFVLLSSSQGPCFFVCNLYLNQEVCVACKRFLKRYQAQNFFRASSPKVQYSLKDGDIFGASVRRATAYSIDSFSERKFVKRQREMERTENKLYAPNSHLK